MIMGLGIAFQWPISFYSGGLMGLQRQVLLNIINITMATFRGLGAILVLWLVSPTVEAFFIWQLVVSIVNLCLIVFFVRRSLPIAEEAPRFRRELFLNIWRFAAGVTGISVLSTILTQMDKIILSRMLSLEIFGYYALANAVAMSLARFMYSVFSATYPRLTNLVAMNAWQELTRLYHKSSQLVSVLVLPAAVVVALFSREILQLWTQNPSTAEHTHLLVSILIMGTAFNGLMNIPYALQLATGWTRLAFFVNLVSVILLVPLMILLTKLYGAPGAASVWEIVNGSAIIFSIQIMHRRLLPAEKWRWYGIDVGLPFAATLLFAGAFRLAIPVPSHTVPLCAYILVCSVITLGATTLATPVTREWVLMRISTWKSLHHATGL
jgi:O-antigen/teichoic acid export membrane protein